MANHDTRGERNKKCHSWKEDSGIQHSTNSIKQYCIFSKQLYKIKLIRVKQMPQSLKEKHIVCFIKAFKSFCFNKDMKSFLFYWQDLTLSS